MIGAVKNTGAIIVLGGLLCAGASFFFALAESALFSLGKWRAKGLSETAQGQRVQRLLEHPSELLATIVLGNSLANGCLVTLFLWPVLQGRWHPLPTLVGLTLFILLACEIFPKTLAVRDPERWSLRVAQSMVWLQKVTHGLQTLVQSVLSRVLALLVPKSMIPQRTYTEEDYQELVELAWQEGTLATSEKEIILQIIQLDRKTARDVMKPRPYMAAISDDLSIEEMMTAARRFKHRRLPIYDETPDTIVGLLNTKALLLNPDVDLSDVVEFPSFVPETMNLLQLLISLQRQQRGLAIVLDEYGGTAGLVTIEDILEEVVGKIQTEEESADFTLEKLGEGRWRVNGALRVDEFRRECPLLGEVPEADTVGGLLMARLEEVPQRDQSVVYRGLRLTALKADTRRVYEVLVERVKKR
jgi:putative hemolysin